MRISWRLGRLGEPWPIIEACPYILALHMLSGKPYTCLTEISSIGIQSDSYPSTYNGSSYHEIGNGHATLTNAPFLSIAHGSGNGS